MEGRRNWANSNLRPACLHTTFALYLSTLYSAPKPLYRQRAFPKSQSHSYAGWFYCQLVPIGPLAAASFFVRNLSTTRRPAPITKCAAGRADVICPWFLDDQWVQSGVRKIFVI